MRIIIYSEDPKIDPQVLYACGNEIGIWKFHFGNIGSENKDLLVHVNDKRLENMRFYLKTLYTILEDVNSLGIKS